MCGIFGVVDYKNKIPREDRRRILRCLGVLNESRGRDAAGLGYLLPDGKKYIYKTDGVARDLSFNKVDEALVVLGHTRASTIGGKTVKQAHPFTYRNFVLTHNGIGFKDHHRFTWAQGESGVDSETMLRYLVATGGVSIENILSFTKAWSDASFSFAMLTDDNKFVSFRKGNPFHWGLINGAMVYSSTRESLVEMAALLDLTFDREKNKENIFYYEENCVLIWDHTDGYTLTKFKEETTESYRYQRKDYSHGVSQFPSHRGRGNHYDTNGDITLDQLWANRHGAGVE
jgi:glucosamine 6-phosphate synthetase-like amidotransferase/phosphosugar isomerase protein